MQVNGDRSPYVCGPLTELPETEREGVKRFYVRIAEACQLALGVRAFVPHEHFDPVKNPNPAPDEVDRVERAQVCAHTSHLIVVPLAPSWGGGIEVEMAYRSGVPIILLCERKKLEARKISRLLRGNPGIAATIVYDTEDHALAELPAVLTNVLVHA